MGGRGSSVGSDGGGSGGNSGGTSQALFPWDEGWETPSQGGPIFGFGDQGWEPGDLGQMLGPAAQTAFQQGPQVFDQELYAGLGEGTTGAINTSMDFLGPIASGSWLEQGGNPYAESILQRGLNDAMTGVNATFGNAGRLGSGRHVDTLGSTLANAANDFRYQQFNDDYNRTLGAQDRMLGLGNVMDQDAQSRLLSEQDLFRRQADAPLGHIADYMGLFQQGGGQFEQRQNPWANVLSTGLGIAGTLGPLLLSDERTKTNIKKVGKTKKGVDVVTYRYKGDPNRTTHMGVLAQQLEKKKPEAVSHIGDVLMVDYAQVA